MLPVLNFFSFLQRQTFILHMTLVPPPLPFHSQKITLTSNSYKSEKSSDKYSPIFPSPCLTVKNPTLLPQYGHFYTTFQLYFFKICFVLLTPVSFQDCDSDFIIYVISPLSNNIFINDSQASAFKYTQISSINNPPVHIHT